MLHAGAERCLDAHTLRTTHGCNQRRGDLQHADLAALGFDIDRALRVKPAQGLPQISLKVALRRLRSGDDVPQYRTAMAGDRFEIEYLPAGFAQRT